MAHLKKRKASGFVVAAIQAPAVYWSIDQSTQRACQLAAKAAGMGASVAVFGEGWLPGYPFFTQRMELPLAMEAAREYLANTVAIPGPVTDRLCKVAKQLRMDIVIGVGELDLRTSGSVYCTLLFIGREGKILGKHRKLKPTGPERLIWSDGDASGLQVYIRPYGRLSGLSCWEHQMVLPEYALISEGTQIHAASWPGWDPENASDAIDLDQSMWPRLGLLSRAFASHAACYVVAAAGMWRQQDVPVRYQPLITRPRTGDSVIIGPAGEVLAGPLHNRPGILMARASLQRIAEAKLQCDTAGHYSRPDVFRLSVNREARNAPIDANRNLQNVQGVKVRTLKRRLAVSSKLQQDRRT